jgi:hypothetical protein
MRTTSSYWLLIIAMALLAGGCKKNSDFVSYETKINYTYNGQQYTNTSPSSISSDFIIVQGQILIVNFTGLLIEDQHNLFQGKLILLARNPGPFQCAYLQPTGSSVFATAGNCSMLNNGGNPIDSVQVYWYESGSVNYTYSDCKAITTATVPGQKDCAISGSFDLTLTNKNGQKMRLTNGSFTGRLRTYP